MSGIYLAKRAPIQRITHRGERSTLANMLAPVVTNNVTGTHGYTCQTCLRDIQKEEVVETSNYWARVRMSCHGAEHVETFRFLKREWTHTDLSRQMRSILWFDPRAVAGGPAPEPVVDELTGNL